ncbi:SRPBCC family protein [Saxibacter everestensis]|uniref:SRPBCC family protein n=1 Tax=Saxibacter everestensis TaxID=2909229 RepID=A0ABY8QQV5_9MICO|nr:SRPBCC family protein [Brevibacteriaceae bacterium ZFBP1038]
MAQVVASASKTMNAEPEQVRSALADYSTVRERILPEQYTDYQVLKGGTGDGTVVRWKLHATKKRIRDVESAVSVDADSVTERDANSTLVTVYRVTPAASGSEVTVTTSWNGAGGIGGFFEKTFAPLGLKKIQASTLDNLANFLG